ncbi:MAG: ABC transporter permease [Sulfuritalea sp.]|nr:ABC transporter permease [Sulfuritalea sp.]
MNGSSAAQAAFAEFLRAAVRAVVVPAIAMAIFLALWSFAAARVQTSLGAVPGPMAVFNLAGGLVTEHIAERALAQEFYVRQEERNRAKLAEDPQAEVRTVAWTGKPTYLDQIFTSLKTVFVGFLLATLIAVPVGIFCGLSKTVQTALNPLIQIFRPVSPLAWLPIVTLIVSAAYVTTGEPMFEKSFLISAITVTLCSLWPTLVNTGIGVSSVDRDLLNVSRALQLPAAIKVRKIIVPSALPYIFTGMRLSLSVGWMVLIAAEMLAQNPGLGKFVWDEFQNGSSDSLGRIMVAVFTIGFIGFLLDRLMMALQSLASRR